MTAALVRRSSAIASAVVLAVLACGSGSAIAADPPRATATAQAAHVDAVGVTAVDLSSPATTSTNDGSGSADPVTGGPDLSVLDGQDFLSAGAASEITQAGQHGSSYACAGIGSPQGGIQIGDGGTDCTATGNGVGGIHLDLTKIPAVGNALLHVATVELIADAITAHADGSAPADPTGDAAVDGLKMSVCLLGCLGGPLVIPVPIPSGPNQNLLTAVVDALTGHGGLTPVVNALSNGLASAVKLVSNYQATQPDGAFRVSGIHIEALTGSAANVDLATVTVGPNSVPTVDTPLVSLTLTAWLAGTAVLAGLLITVVRRTPLGRHS